MPDKEIQPVLGKFRELDKELTNRIRLLSSARGRVRRMVRRLEEIDTREDPEGELTLLVSQAAAHFENLFRRLTRGTRRAAHPPLVNKPASARAQAALQPGPEARNGHGHAHQKREHQFGVSPTVAPILRKVFTRRGKLPATLEDALGVVYGETWPTRTVSRIAGPGRISQIFLVDDLASDNSVIRQGVAKALAALRYVEAGTVPEGFTGPNGNVRQLHAEITREQKLDDVVRTIQSWGIPVEEHVQAASP